ncbi:hypothetical protein [Haloferula sp. BvORR071]|uniref:hypothetical protein n=1 Tax=Haloferula sp. BvORR071 TaxID=1396141 RepID=UPI00054D4A13|nr:hypothetical protein [Haloferula sp. BvORR071]
MKLRLLALVLLIFPLLLKAAEITAAWSVPLDYVAPSHESWGNTPKLKKPPGQSAFFQPGDELWDLSRGFMGARLPDDGEGILDKRPERFEPGDLRGFRKWPGKWLVWNARSGMLVARGSETDILMAGELMNFANLPVTLRARFELSTGSAEKLRTVALAAQSGEQATAEGEGLEMEARLLDPGHHGYGDAALKGAWEVNGERWAVETSFTVHYGERTRIAAHGTGEERWELFATITREFFHGVPVSESRGRETEKGIERWPLEAGREGFEASKAGDSPNLRIYHVAPDFFAGPSAGIEKAGGAAAPDPFGPEEAPATPQVGAPSLPGGWDGWLQGEFIDLRAVMKGKGMSLDREGDFAVMNPRTHSVLLFGASLDHDLFELLVDGIGCYIRNDVWLSSNPESGGWGLTARSGESAALYGTRDGEEMSFKIEPILDDPSFVQLGYKFDNRAEARGGVRVEASSKFLLGSPQTIGSRQVSGRDEEKVVITAAYLYP